MPEFEPDPESVSRANELSSRLVRDMQQLSEGSFSIETLKEFSSERQYAEQTGGVSIVDVLENVGQMAREFSLGRRWGEGVLCLKLDDDELAPISTMSFFGDSSWPPIASGDWVEFWERYGPFPPHRLWGETLRRITSVDDRIIVASLAKAEAGVRRGLSGFLSYRFAGMKMDARGRRRATPSTLRLLQIIRERFFGSSPLSPDGRGARGGGQPPAGARTSGGLQVRVSCHTPGLRIHISPAYFINWVYFGSPTTPVTSYVLPGRYVFSGDGPMLPKRRADTGVFNIPPTYDPFLASF